MLDLLPQIKNFEYAKPLQENWPLTERILRLGVEVGLDPLLIRVGRRVLNCIELLFLFETAGALWHSFHIL